MVMIRMMVVTMKSTHYMAIHDNEQAHQFLFDYEQWAYWWRLMMITFLTKKFSLVIMGRAEMPTFSTLNLDGSSSPPPAPPPPSPPSPFICYDDCEDDDHCSDCGKCAVLCHEHHGCDCCGEEGLDITFHCAVCCCGRSLEGQYCKLKDLLSPEAFQTASHPYLWHRSFCSHSQ